MQQSSTVRSILVRGIVGALLAAVAAVPASAVNIVTRNYDNARTGANLNEFTLTTSNVNVNQFGKLWAYVVDGHVYAQPLIVQGVSIGGVSRNVVFIATMHNTVYAFDADSGSPTPLWSVNLGTSIPMPDPTIGSACGSYRDIFNEIGIISTPVIDTATNTIYVEAKTTGYVDRLHALDLSNGAEKLGGPVTISATLNGRSLQGQYANQRTSLVLANGRVYLGFGGYCDTGTYYGWYFGYSASNLAAAPIVFNAGFDGSAAPVWMAGGAAAVDGAGNLYVVTGNGTFNANTGGQSYAETYLKLSPTLGVLDWFTPYNQQSLTNVDADLGSAGPLLIPGTSTVTSGGKEGKLYLVNTSNMGHYNSTADSQILQSFKAAPAHIHGAPVYWNGPSGPLVYVMAETDALKGYLLSNGVLNTTPFTQSSVKAPAGSMPGGILAVSANGSAANSGIVWANMAIASDANQGLAFGVLRAFNATNLTQELWNSQMNASRDAFGLLAKFVPPTVANGRVYMPGFSKQVAVYGILGSVPTPAPTPTPTAPASGNLALGKYAAGSIPCAATEAGDRAVNGSVTGGNTDKFCSTQGGYLHLIVDLGGTYSVNSITVRHAGAGGESASLNTKDFTVKVSTDALTWNTVATVTGNTANVTTHAVPVQNARYARIDVTAPTSTTDTAMRIYEFEVYGSGGTSTPTPTATATTTSSPTPTVAPTPNGSNLALNKAATGSAACATTEGPEKAVNGTVSGGNADKWCSGVAPLSLQVDLAANSNVTGFVVRHAGAGGEAATLNTRDFTIQLSTDNATWSTPVTVIGNTLNVTTHTIPTTVARYARMNITAATQTTEATARVYEFEVYGTVGATPTARATATSTATPTATTRATATATSTPTATTRATPTPTSTTGGTATTVSLASAFNVNVAYTDGTTFASTGGIDGVGSAYSSTLLGTSFTWSGTPFNFGAANALNGVRNATITLPAGQYATLLMLGTGVNGDQASQTVRVNYTDGTNSTFTQTFSNWLNASQSVAGQAIASTMAYRNKSTGVKDNRAFNLYGYSFALTSTRTVSSLVLPANNNVSVLAVTLRTAGGATPTSTPTATATARPTATPTATATTGPTPTPTATTGTGSCSGGTGAQTGLASVSCAGVPAWSGSTSYASGAQVTYNGCLYQANQGISPNPSWCPGCSGIFLYGNGTACPTPGCNFGAQGPCQ